MSKPYKILFKFATRSRPEKYKACVENIIANLADRNNYLILVTADKDDASMNNEEIRKFSNSKPYVRLYYGESKNKIAAINRDMEMVAEDGWEILVNTSDDMQFVYPAFDNAIRDAFEVHFKEDLDGVVHFSDGNQGKNVMTMSIMGRKYYERFGYIYHPDYESLACDMEATDVARLLDKYRYMGDQRILFRHLHPSFGLAEYDPQYRKTEDWSVRSRDHETYERRKKENFGLTT